MDFFQSSEKKYPIEVVVVKEKDSRVTQYTFDRSSSFPMIAIRLISRKTRRAERSLGIPTSLTDWKPSR